NRRGGSEYRRVESDGVRPEDGVGVQKGLTQRARAGVVGVRNECIENFDRPDVAFAAKRAREAALIRGERRRIDARVNERAVRRSFGGGKGGGGRFGGGRRQARWWRQRNGGGGGRPKHKER